MFESFIASFVIYFVVIDPVGTIPIFVAVSTGMTRVEKQRMAIEGTLAAGGVLFFIRDLWHHYFNLSRYFTYCAENRRRAAIILYCIGNAVIAPHGAKGTLCAYGPAREPGRYAYAAGGDLSVGGATSGRASGACLCDGCCQRQAGWLC